MQLEISHHLTSHELLSESQYGFRPGLSTVKAVENVVSFILDSFESGLSVHTTLVDLSKAFDSVNHKILLKKMWQYGMRSTVLSLIESYLKDRKQMVDFNNVRSSALNVTRGAPQGSILGPLLFVIYVNDLPYQIQCKSVLYADDTTFLIAGKDVDTLKSQSEEHLRAAGNWFQNNELKLNEDKTI
jgi:Retron-type reverse transcriptase